MRAPGERTLRPGLKDGRGVDAAGVLEHTLPATPEPPMRPTTLLLITLLVASLATGCTSRTWIKPTEIGVFAKPPTEFRGQTPIRTFTGPDRRLVRVKGDPNVRLHLLGGGQRSFRGPVVVTALGDDRYSINDGREPFEFSTDTLSSVALERRNAWKGLAWAGVGVAAFTGLVFVIVGLSGGVKAQTDTTTSAMSE